MKISGSVYLHAADTLEASKEEKLYLHFDIKFDDESDYKKTSSRPPKWPSLTPCRRKMKILTLS